MSDPLSPVVRGDRLYGRGAYDMKGGLAAALIACREAARRGLEVIVAAVADEEHSSLGVQEVLRHVRADAAIVTEDTERDIAGLLDRCRAADPALRVSSRTTLARAPFEVADDEPIVQAVARAAEATTGKPAGASYWADAAFIAAAGIPTVLFGPDGDGAHAREEWVSLPGTVACAQALTAAALDFCGG